MARQPPTARSAAPTVGAIIGTILMAKTTLDIFARAAAPSKRSLTMVTAAIPGPEAPAPCSARKNHSRRLRAKISPCGRQGRQEHVDAEGWQGSQKPKQLRTHERRGMKARGQCSL